MPTRFRGAAVLCFMPSTKADTDPTSGVRFGWWQGYLACTLPISTTDNRSSATATAAGVGRTVCRMVGTPSVAPPEPHNCWKLSNRDERLRFWDVRVSTEAPHSGDAEEDHPDHMDVTIPNVLHLGGDAVRLTSKLDPSAFADVPTDPLSDDDDDNNQRAPTQPQNTELASKQSNTCALRFSSLVVQVDEDARASIYKYFPSLAVHDCDDAIVCVGRMIILVA